MTEIRVGLDASRTRAALSVPPGRVAEMDGAAVEALIWQLAGAREAMEPPRPGGNPQPGVKVATGVGMRWYMEPGPEAGSVQVMLFHPGLGWTAIMLDAPGVEGFAAGLEQTRKA